MVNKCNPFQTHKERNNRESEVRETVDIYSCLKSKERRKEFIDYGSECAREFIKATVVEAEKAKATATATATEPST
jgi:hypothetical protein